MQTFDLHPLCQIFPPMAAAEFAELVADIRTHGQREPIRLYEGKILDGANRYRACIEAGVEPRIEGWHGDDPAAYVLSANLHRRHLPEGQRAEIVEKVYKLVPKPQRGNQPNPSTDGFGPLAPTVAQRAAIAGVSIPTQERAARVEREAPELATQVASGELSIPQALRTLRGEMPRLEQEPKRKHASEREEGEPEPYTQADELQNARAQIGELQDIIAAQEHELEAFRKLAEGDQAVALEIKILKDQVRTLTLARDSYMSKSRELIREVKSLRRKLGLK